jgi:hypothetical protein
VPATVVVEALGGEVIDGDGGIVYELPAAAT